MWRNLLRIRRSWVGLARANWDVEVAYLWPVSRLAWSALIASILEQGSMGVRRRGGWLLEIEMSQAKGRISSNFLIAVFLVAHPLRGVSQGEVDLFLGVGSDREGLRLG